MADPDLELAGGGGPSPRSATDDSCILGGWEVQHFLS